MVIAPFLRKSVSSTISLPSLSRKVSVIIPTYKEVLNLKKLIPAIFNGEIKTFFFNNIQLIIYETVMCTLYYIETRKVNIDAEVLIVDDNSGDGSVELVEELKKNSDIDVRFIYFSFFS
jgi:glycosyltransferase involved in cell wall biosynthesis